MPSWIVMTLLPAILMIVSPGLSAAEQKCPDWSREYAQKRGSYYDPEAAYRFAALIQRYVAERDLAGLFSLVDGELGSGPRRRVVEWYTFDEVFSESWRNAVLADEPPCDPVGYRGFMLAQGRIWFDKRGASRDTWRIIAINGATIEDRAMTPPEPAWRVDGKVLSPQCFVKIWMSYDNFEAYEERYGITDTEDFRSHTGRYFGREIDRLEPIEMRWGNEKIPLAVFVDTCASNGPTEALTIGPDGVSRRVCGEDDGRACAEDRYQRLAALPEGACRQLAPDMPGQCESAYLVQVGDYSGGSMGWDYAYNVYGLFRLDNGRKVIVPLVNFGKKNDALNFVESLGAAR